MPFGNWIKRRPAYGIETRASGKNEKGEALIFLVKLQDRVPSCSKRKARQPRCPLQTIYAFPKVARLTRRSEVL
jgi:hypothetical protein